MRATDLQTRTMNCDDAPEKEDVLPEDWKQYVRDQVGEHIRRKREAAGLSQEELFRITGITQPALSAVEQGRRGLSVYSLARLAQGLGLTLDELVPTTSLDEYPEALK